MYLLPEKSLDDGFDKNRTTIFPSNSPVTNLEPVKTKPIILSRKKFGRLASLAKTRIMPLLKARKNIDKVHADGYFENHYPEADKKLKSLIHEDALIAWGNAENPSKEVLEEKAEGKELGSGGTTIVLNISIGK